MNYPAPKFCRRLLGRRARHRLATTVQLVGSLALWLAYTAVALAQSPGATPTPYQDVAALEAAAKSAAESALPPLTEHQRLVVGPVLSTQLDRCKQSLQSKIGAGQHLKDRLMVELRCPDRPATTVARAPTADFLWHIYVPVRVVGTSSALIATHAIPMGGVLTANDLRIEQHDLSELPTGFLDDPALAVGMTAARAIAGGSVLTNQQIAAAKVVQRGQSVTLVADADGMSVRMSGRALTDGMVNQRVKVQNLSSGKVVEGIARSEQVVEIVFQ